MKEDDFVSNHPMFGKGSKRTPLELSIVECERRVRYDEECVRISPGDAGWMAYLEKDMRRLHELQEEWKRVNRIKDVEDKCVQLTLEF